MPVWVKWGSLFSAGYMVQVLWGECISGALYKGDFIRLAQQVGFQDPRSVSSAPIEVTDPELKDVVGNAQFSSITYRYALQALFFFYTPVHLQRVSNVTSHPGTIPSCTVLHTFNARDAVLCCGGTA
jgi:hypothetical protein